MVAYKKKTLRKRGGEVMDIGYKYTRSKNRAQWTNKLYPHGAVFASILRNIDWGGYKFTGNSLVKLAQLDKYGELPSNPDYVAQIGNITVDFSVNTPYYVFGGAACELLNTKTRRFSNLHATTDPTGDIDVNIMIPQTVLNDIQRNDDIYTADKVVLYNEDAYTAFGQDFSNWLFNQVVEQLGTLRSEVKNNVFMKPAKEDMEETATADKVVFVDKYMVTQTVGQWIKIQVSLAVREAGADHIMEFVMDKEYNMVENFMFLAKTRRTVVHINGINVMGPIHLLEEQVQAFGIRKKLYDDVSGERNLLVHKVANHKGRILFLAKLLSYVAKAPQEFSGEFGYGVPHFIIERHYKTLQENGLGEEYLKAIFFYQPGDLKYFRRV